MAVILGLPALLQAIATIGVGGAIGYKAQKDLKDSNIDIRNLEDPQIKMLRAMFPSHDPLCFLAYLSFLLHPF